MVILELENLPNIMGGFTSPWAGSLKFLLQEGIKG